MLQINKDDFRTFCRQETWVWAEVPGHESNELVLQINEDNLRTFCAGIHKVLPPLSLDLSQGTTKWVCMHLVHNGTSCQILCTSWGQLLEMRRTMHSMPVNPLKHLLGRLYRVLLIGTSLFLPKVLNWTVCSLTTPCMAALIYTTQTEKYIEYFCPQWSELYKYG